MKQGSKQHRNNRHKGGRRSGGGGGGGHSANRVYDSAGPEGKVRGTAAQIIDKYTSLARDAMTSGDRITAESFYQHAEHYQRILTTIQAAEAEERERRAQQQAQNQNSNQQNQNERRGNGDGNAQRDDNRSQSEATESAASADTAGDDDKPQIVETPEARKAEERGADERGAEKRPRRARRAKSDESEGEAATNGDASGTPSPVENAEEAPAPKARRGRPRKTPPPEEVDAASS